MKRSIDNSIRRSCGGALLALLLPAAAAAQNEISISNSYALVLRLAPAATAPMANSAHAALVRADWQVLEQQAVTPGFRMRVSSLGPVSFAKSGPPLVTAVTVDRGPQAGGTATLVQGLRLTDGFGVTTVAVGGAPATVAGASSTSISIATGPGANAYGNPLGPADVVVSHANGSGARDDAFTYQPAVRNLSSGSIGAALELEYTGAPGSLFQLWAGGIFPGVAVPIAPFEGAIEVWNPAFVLTALLFAPTGDELVPIFIPADPTLVGATLRIQGISVTQLFPALAGSFTNALPVTFAP